jgi:hypothetical protein
MVDLLLETGSTIILDRLPTCPRCRSAKSLHLWVYGVDSEKGMHRRSGERHHLGAKIHHPTTRTLHHRVAGLSLVFCVP